MSIQLWAGAAAIAACVPILWWSASGARVRPAVARKNLKMQLGAPNDLRAIQLAAPARDRITSPTMERLAQQARRITPSGWVKGLERRIELAGMAATWPVERVLAFKLLFALMGAVVAVMVLLSNPSPVTFLWAALVVAMAWLGPETILSRRARERQANILEELPDVLDQVTISVEAGLAFEPALARAAATRNGPMAEEFRRALGEIRSGLPRNDAFRNILDRTEVPDLRHFVVSIEQASRHGVPIAKVLRVQAEELRDKRRQRAEEKAQKVPVKVLFPVIFCILPALFVAVLGGAVIQTVDTFSK